MENGACAIAQENVRKLRKPLCMAVQMNIDQKKKDHASARFEKSSLSGDWQWLNGRPASPAKSVFICVHLWFSRCMDPIQPSGPG